MTSRSGFLVLGLLLLTAIPREAAAQSADGPFFSRQHLVSYWQGVSTTQAREISLNAYVVYQGMGFGPAIRQMYFSCMDGFIRPDCNQLQGPFQQQYQAVDYLNQSPGAGNLRAYLDGSVILNGFGPLFGTYYYVTCRGDTSPFGYGVLSYIAMQSGSNIYGPVPAQGCLPRL